ncbi:MAG: hypothetical protein M1840_008323 [Geoglossum simile]|nr:MAG: hypothetical protein M1840_008323 [Geoglossum simile]
MSSLAFRRQQKYAVVNNPLSAKAGQRAETIAMPLFNTRTQAGADIGPTGPATGGGPTPSPPEIEHGAGEEAVLVALTRLAADALPKIAKRLPNPGGKEPQPGLARHTGRPCGRTVGLCGLAWCQSGGNGAHHAGAGSDEGL